MAYQWHHLATFYVAASAVSVCLDVLDLSSGPPFALASESYRLAWVMLLFAMAFKGGSAAAVAQFAQRSGAGYSEYLMSGS